MSNCKWREGHRASFQLEGEVVCSLAWPARSDGTMDEAFAARRSPANGGLSLGLVQTLDTSSTM